VLPSAAVRCSILCPGLCLVVACAGEPTLDARRQTVINALADDNAVWARREPTYVAMKLAKMQREPFIWLRGTAGLYWRDLTTPGTDRPATAFGDAPSSRVLLVGDPHPENLGSFRAPDGTMVVDWNDFDSAGYGPFEGDVRRLAAAMIIAGASDVLGPGLAREVALGYAATIADLAAGRPAPAVGLGDEPYLDALINKAVKKGDAGATLAELAPVEAGVEVVPFGDLSPVGADGVIEKRLAPVSAEAAVYIDAAIARWRPTALVPLTEAAARVKLRMRRFGAGVASYAALRFYAVLEGPTAAPDDDLVVELKEERDGVAITALPAFAPAPWASPAARAVDAQRRLHARADADPLLGAGDVAPLSLRIHTETAYQRGVSAADLAALAAGTPAEQAQLRALARRFGALLARAHGRAATADGAPGFAVIAPRVADAAAFAEEVTALAAADAAAILADFHALAGVDLAALVLPLVPS
jgi:uncharacterized protein (DUF2252 family)